MMSNIFIPDRDLKHKFRKELEAAGTSQLGVMGLVACEAAYSKGGGVVSGNAFLCSG